MKLPQFEYASPATLTEAVALLAQHHGDARLLAGGQSLVPLLAFRLASPQLLIDLRRLQGLDQIKIEHDGIRIGAMTRWCDIEANPDLVRAHPLLVEAVKHVAHYQIRNRGTIGGSLAHADPAAEIPGIAVACDATIGLTGSNGARTIAADDFFIGPLTTAIRADEIIVEICFPPWPRSRRWAFEEFARRRGDFALAGIAAFYDPDREGRANNVHIGVIGAGPRPRRLLDAEREVNARAIEDRAIAAAAKAAAREVDPTDDIHASAAYRRALVEALVERALKSAAGREV